MSDGLAERLALARNRVEANVEKRSHGTPPQPTAVERMERRAKKKAERKARKASR